MVRLIDPSLDQVLREIPFMSSAQVSEAIADSSEAFEHWRRVGLEVRLECVRSLENALTAARITLAEQISREMGKVQREALAEVDKCVQGCAQLREKLPVWKSEREYREGEFQVSYQPLGPLLAIMPWNFPVWQVIRFAIPALLNGNTVLLKHAPNTWGVAERLADLMAQALPHNVFLNLQTDVDQVPSLLADQRLRGVSLTGSRAAGASVAAVAGAHLKKTVLELGGSDAYVVLDDADLEKAADICVRARLQNAGQSCVAAKRFIVTSKNAKAFTDAMVARMAAVKWGSAFDAQAEIGPLARRDLRDGLHQQVQKSITQGAKLLVGGRVPDAKGYFYPASVLAGVKPGMVAFDEELFGPVASIIEAQDEKDAFRLANLSNYGLGGAIFSRDKDRAYQLALTEMEAGMVFINDFVRSDVRIPFGGVKDSGLGRELGREGCFEFCNVKVIKS